jgi:regulator of nucleoside diphosphate kinase
MTERAIFVTEEDFGRLEGLLAGAARQEGRDRENVRRLAEELDRAQVVPADSIPADVVTMNSEVVLRNLDTGEAMVFTVVFPGKANVEQQRLSVLAPLGAAVLGYRAGDVIEWEMPGGVRRLKIEKVLYQPEAARKTEG